MYEPRTVVLLLAAGGVWIAVGSQAESPRSSPRPSTGARASSRTALFSLPYRDRPRLAEAVGDARLTGEVVDETGEPLGNMFVSVCLADGETCPSSTFTDDRGRFVVSDLVERPYLVSASDSAFLERWPVVAVPGEPVRIEVTRGGVATLAIAIDGEVCARERASRDIDRRFNPCNTMSSWLEVALDRREDDGWVDSGYRRHADVGCDESPETIPVRLDGLADGEYRPRVAFSVISTIGPSFEISDASRATTLEATLEPGTGRVWGTVRARSGATWDADAWIVCAHASEPGHRRCVEPDRTGQFSIDGIDEGKRSVGAGAVTERYSWGEPNKTTGTFADLNIAGSTRVDFTLGDPTATPLGHSMCLE